MSDLKTTLTAQFGREGFGASAGGELTLSAIGYPVGVNSISIKLVDTVQTGALQLYATSGIVTVFSDEEESIPTRYEIVQGVTVIETPYLETISFPLAFNEQGQPFTPVVTPIDGNRRKRLNVKTWALVERSAYTRPFKILKYSPEMGGLGTSLFINYGSVAAYKEGHLAVYNPEPTTGADNQDVEIYRVTSRMVVNDLGGWEYPNGWPSAPAYTGGATPVPEADSGVVVQRVHEICMMNPSSGYTYRRNYPIKREVPYTAITGYKPTIVQTNAAAGSLPAALQTRAAAIQAQRPSEGYPYGNL